MLEQQQPATLRAKVKAQIIKEIFKDLNPKNLKGVESFFLICRQQKMELQFMSISKDILITIILKRQLFAHYHYNKKDPALHKYALEDFMGIGIMFENNKQILDLEIDQAKFLLTYTGGLGQTQFYGQSLSSDQDDIDLVIGEKDFRPEEEESNCMELKLSRVNIFERALRFIKGIKSESIWFRYDSVSQKLEVTDKKENQEARWQLKVEQIFRNTLNSQQEFHFKSFYCAMNLLPNDSPLKLTFYPSFMLIEVLEKERTFFTIRLSAMIDRHE